MHFFPRPLPQNFRLNNSFTHPQPLHSRYRNGRIGWRRWRRRNRYPTIAFESDPNDRAFHASPPLSRNLPTSDPLCTPHTIQNRGYRREIYSQSIGPIADRSSAVYSNFADSYSSDYRTAPPLSHYLPRYMFGSL